jgi:UDP-glucose 4-epimerase
VLEDREIQIFGNGRQFRDFVYVDDAVDAFLRAGATDDANGMVINIGGDEPISHVALADLMVSVAGSGRYRLAPWPPDKKAIDIGDFSSDSSLALRTFGWRPETALRDGLARTFAFYREHWSHYVPPADAARTP